MPRPLPPPDPNTADAATLAPILADMDARDLFADINNPARWTLDLILQRQRGTLSRRLAAAAQRYVITTLGVPNLTTKWAILNASDVLPLVNVTGLTVELLAVMVRGAEQLHSGVFGKLWRTREALASAASARKATVAASTPPGAGDFTAWIDRAAEQLALYLVT